MGGGAEPHLEGGLGGKAPSLGSICVYILILPTQNPVIFNNFFLEKEAFGTVIYRKKIPSIGLSKS